MYNVKTPMISVFIWYTYLSLVLSDWLARIVSSIPTSSYGCGGNGGKFSGGGSGRFEILNKDHFPQQVTRQNVQAGNGGAGGWLGAQGGSGNYSGKNGESGSKS